MSGKRIIRNLAAFLGYLALSLGILLTLIILLTRTAFFRQWLQDALIQQTQKKLGVTLSLDRIEGDPLTGLTLQRIALQDREGGRVSLDRLSVQLSLAALLSGRLTVPLLSISGLHLPLVRTREGGLSLCLRLSPPPAVSPPDSKGLPPLNFKRILIHNGCLTLRDESLKEPAEISIQKIQADLSLYLRQGNWVADLRHLSLSLSPDGVRPDGVRPDGVRPCGVVVQKIQGGISLRQGVVEMDKLEILTPESHFFFQGRVNLQEEPFFDVQGRFPRISIEELRNILGKDQFPAFLLRLSSLKGEVRVRGPLKNLDCSLDISFETQGQRGQWQAQGLLDLSDLSFPRYQLRTSFKRFPVVWWLPEKQRAALPDYIDLRARIRGEGISPVKVSFEADTSAFTMFGQPVDGVGLSGRLDGQSLQLTRLEVSSPGGRARLQGQIDLRPPLLYQLTLSFRHLDLGQLNIKGLPSSRLDGEAQFQGGAGRNFPQSFQAVGSVRLSPSRLGERFLDNLVLEGDIEDGLVRLSRGNIQMEGLDLSLSGTVSRQRLHLVWNLQKMDLSQTVGSLLEGIVSGQGKITGDTQNPVLEGELTALDLSYRDYRVSRLVGQGRAVGRSFQTFRFEAQTSSLWHGQQKMLDTFWIKARKKGDRVNWQLRGTQAGNTGTQAGNTEEGNIKEGNARDNIKEGNAQEGNRLLQAEGLLEIPDRRQVSIQVNEIVFPLGKTTWQNTGPIRVELGSEALRVLSLRIGSGQAYLSAQGELEWAGSQNVQVQLSGLPLQEMSKWTGPAVPLFGTLSGEAHLSGTRQSPGIEGKLEIVNGKWSTFSFDRLAQVFAYSQKNLTATTSLVQAGKETLHITGSLPVDLSFLPVRDRWSRPGAQVQVWLQELDLSFLPSVFPLVAGVKGSISGKGQMSGSLLDPRFEGNVAFIDTSFRVKPLFQVFKIKKALITGNSQRIAIEEVSLTGESGMGKFSGAVELDGFSVKSLKARASMDKWKIFYSRNTYFVFDGDLAAQGILPRVSLIGSILVSEAKVRMSDFDFGRQNYPEIQVVQTRGDELKLLEKKPDFFKQNVSLDLKVNIPRNLWISGDQAEVELKGDMNIRKTYEQTPTITGSIETIRGTYTFYGKEFIIERGIIQFQGLPQINPLLDMKTVYQVGGTNVFILITGTRKTPVISLQSDDKTLSQDTLISLLVFGQPPENLNQRESASLQGEAFALLGRLVATEVLGIFGEKLPVDTIQIRASEQGISTLEVGKYLTRDVFVSFGKEFGQEKGSEQVKVEYYLYSNLTLEAEIRSDQRSGVDLIWKKDF